MKYLFIPLFFVSIFFKCSILYSQDTINLMNGRQIAAKSVYNDTASTLLKYEINARNNVKQLSVDKIEIYSIRYADHSEKIMYRQDTAIGYKLSAAEMRYYILGERDAIKYYKSSWITYSGVPVGFFPTIYYLNFWGAWSIPLYTTIIGVINPKIKISKVSNPDLTHNINFNDGYRAAATKKRVKNALMGSIVGFASAAIISWTLVCIKK
jgi:hypothetical protein